MRSVRQILKWTVPASELTADELRMIIDKADLAYHRPGSDPIMDDAHYDSLRPALDAICSTDPRITRVGCPYDESELRNKVPHTIPMGSLDNTDDSIAGYQPWFEKLGLDGAKIMASLKIDGGSIRAKYVDGVLVEVATRGNGEVGENITVNGAMFQNLPPVLPQPVTMDVRGEAVLYKADYKIIRSRDQGMPFDDIPEKDQSNPRNIGNGTFSRDDGRDADKMRFIAFNIVDDDFTFLTEEGKFAALKDLGFQPVPHAVCETVEDVVRFYAAAVDGRDALPFEIDGVVVCLDSVEQQNKFVTKDPKTRLRPKYARAIKFPHKSGITTIESVLVTVGHAGSLAPTAVLKEVRIGGVNVTHALLNNWDEIERLDIAIGDEVEVVLAGDIIPKVIRVVKKSPTRTPIAEPKRCPSCGEPVSRYHRGKKGAVTYCSLPLQCAEAMLGKVDHWIGTSKKGIGIMDIGDTILRAMWDDQLISDPADLYGLTVNDLKDVELSGGGRIGESRAKKIVANVAAKKNILLPMFLGALGIDLLGRRRAIILMENAGGELDTLEDWMDLKKLQTIEIAGFGDSIRAAVIGGIQERTPLIEKLIAAGVTIDYPEAVEDSEEGSMADVSFCFTGTRECIAQVQELGATIKNSVAKSKPSPDFLVQKDPMSTSNKSKNAEANGHTRIISIAHLKRVLAGEATLDA